MTKGLYLTLWNPGWRVLTHVSLFWLSCYFVETFEWEEVLKAPSDTFRQTQEVFLEDAK